MKKLTNWFYGGLGLLMVGMVISGIYEVSPVASIAGTGVAFVGLKHLAKHVVMPNGVAMMAIDVSDVVAEHGAVYKDSGQAVKDIQLAFRERSVTDMLFNTRVTTETILHKSSASITKVLQRYQKQFTAKGDTALQPRKILLDKLKVDVEEVPDDLEQDWHGFLTDSGLSRKDWPFVKWWLEKLVLPQMQEDWELDEVYKGVQGAITPGTATLAGANINGIRKIINDFITAGDIVPISTGALSSDPVTFVTQMEDFVKQIPRKYLSSISKIAVNEDKGELFREGMDLKYNTNYMKEGSVMKIRYKNIELMGLPSMAGDDKIWTTVKGNAVMGIKKPKNQKIFKIEEHKRLVSAHTDFYKTPGFWIPEWVFTNDQELT